MAFLWLSLSDLLYMKLPYPALGLLALAGIGRFFLEAAGPSGVDVFRLVLSLFCILLVGSFSAVAIYRKRMGGGDGIVLMILAVAFPADQVLVILVVGFLLAGMAALLMVWTKQGQRLPLVPFLGVGCLFVELLR